MFADGEIERVSLFAFTQKLFSIELNSRIEFVKQM